MCNENDLVRRGDVRKECLKMSFYPALVNAALMRTNAVDAVEVVHGEWVLTVHNQIVNGRRSVTAQCSECCEDKGEIWAGFFPGIPDDIADSVALQSAESVKISNYCPNCGAKMDGWKRGDINGKCVD